MITLAVIAAQDGRKKKKNAGILVLQQLAHSISTECRKREFRNFKGYYIHAKNNKNISQPIFINLLQSN